VKTWEKVQASVWTEESYNRWWDDHYYERESRCKICARSHNTYCRAAYNVLVAYIKRPGALEGLLVVDE
jgi:hypothetical protein